MSVTSTRIDNVAIVRIEGPAQRNAVDRATAQALG